MSNLYQTLGRFDDALREMEAAAQSPYSAGVVVAQYIRSKLHKLRLTGGSADDWRKLELAAGSSASRFGPASSEPIILQADIGVALGKMNEVIQYLRKETARRPGDAVLWSQLASVVAQRHGTAAGLTVVDEAQAAAGDGPEIRIARGKLYAAEPGRIRPLTPLGERIDSWPETEQVRLLYGLVELFDHVGDQPAVVRTLQRIANRRPSDATIWARIHERATRIDDKKAAADAREALAKLRGGNGNAVLLCDAAMAKGDGAPREIERLVAAFGSSPVRSDACLALARLDQLVGKVADAGRMMERAFTLEPTHYEAAQAWLAYLCRSGTEDQPRQLIARLAADPRWAGSPFRRLIGACRGRSDTRGRQTARGLDAAVCRE